MDAVNRGVSQGSCLSPLLFSIYVRELPACCPSSTFQFADDTTASEADKSLDKLADKLNTTFNCIKEFCNSHELTINVDKTQLIIFKAASKRILDNFEIIKTLSNTNTRFVFC